MSGSPTSPTLTFLGGADTVTGSKTLLAAHGAKVLVDCGLFQGPKQLRLRNWEPFPVPPASLDAVILTHAHIDHCGYLPRLVKEGFRGPVYCTPGTQRLAGIMLPDSGHLQEEDADHANRHGYSRHDPALPLYTSQDAVNSLNRLTAVAFDTPETLVPGIEAVWRRAGHILGAASIHLLVAEGDDAPERRVVFSGDLGRGTHPLLLPPEEIGAADVVVTESTYGDEDHPRTDPEQVIAEAVNRAVRRGGIVLVPAFAVDRTEVVLWHLDRLVRSGLVPEIPVYLDSPMASRALDVYQDEARRGSPEFRPEFRGTGLFPALRVTETRTVEESKHLNSLNGPLVIVSASGMATGGRVVHHLANRLGSDRNVVLLVGFQAPGTRGSSLAGGATELRMLGELYPVRAAVLTVSLSSHADRGDLVEWLGGATRPPARVYVNHGEPAAAAALAQLLRRDLGQEVVIPGPGDTVALGDQARAAGTRDSGAFHRAR